MTLLKPLLDFLTQTDNSKDILSGFVVTILTAFMDVRSNEMYHHFVSQPEWIDSILQKTFNISVCNFFQKVFLHQQYLAEQSTGSDSNSGAMSELEKGLKVIRERILDQLIMQLNQFEPIASNILAIFVSSTETPLPSTEYLRTCVFSDKLIKAIISIIINTTVGSIANRRFELACKFISNLVKIESEVFKDQPTEHSTNLRANLPEIFANFGKSMIIDGESQVMMSNGEFTPRIGTQRIAYVSLISHCSRIGGVFEPFADLVVNVICVC